MQSMLIESFQNLGIYGYLTTLKEHIDIDAKPRTIAFNILKEARMVARKTRDPKLAQLAPIAFDISTHESIYRMAAFLYLELDMNEEALQCLTYLYYFYKDNVNEPHKQYEQIKQKIIEKSENEEYVNRTIENDIHIYLKQKDLNNIKEFRQSLPAKSSEDQANYFTKIYRRFGTNAVIVSVVNDSRFNNRQKAILLIRASRAVALIADEGSSIESIFANKALELDKSDTVVNNSYKAYLRAGDLNKVSQLRTTYPEFLEG